MPVRTCKRTKNADVIHFGNKQQLSNEQNDCKKQSEQVITYLRQKKQESKQKHKQTIAQDRYDNVLQNAKISNSKKVQHSFCHYRTKKEHKNTREKIKYKYLGIGDGKHKRKHREFAQK